MTKPIMSKKERAQLIRKLGIASDKARRELSRRPKRSWKDISDKFRHIGSHAVVASAIASVQPQVAEDRAFWDLLTEAETACKHLREFCEERMT